MRRKTQVAAKCYEMCCFLGGKGDRGDGRGGGLKIRLEVW
jgi:hypothetical protein